jgi:hypothetical protein
MATGEYVCHLDGDDYWLPNKLKIQLKLMIQTNTVVSWHKTDFITDDNLLYSGEALDYSIFKDGIVNINYAFRLGSIGVHSSIMYKKMARKTKNPSFPTLDIFYTWEYLYQGDGLVISEVLGIYRLNSSGSISSKNIESRLEIVSQHLKYYLINHPERRKDIFIISITNLLIELKNRRKSFLIFLRIALNTFSYISILEFINHMKNIKKLRFPPKIKPIRIS